MNALRPLQEKDLLTLLDWRNNESIRKFMFSQDVISYDEHFKWFESSRENELKSNLIFEIEETPIGFVSFAEESWGKVADWGFYIAPSAPKGTGTLLGNAAISYGFDKLCFHKICGQAISHNEKSINFHSALGFVHEATLKDQYFDGKSFFSVLHFGLIKED